MSIRVLVVDDSAMMRKAIRQILETDLDIEVVATARDGEDALKKDQELSPDVITLDINMPVMDGLTCLSLLFDQNPKVQVVMVSSLTQEGAITTFEAMELGAFDYVAKPSGTVSANMHIVGRELIAKVKAAAKRRRRRSVPSSTQHSAGRSAAAMERPARRERSLIVPDHGYRKVVVIGVSTGGPSTLMEILPHLPADLDAAVIVVQHMPPTFTTSFAKRLDDYCQLRFSEAKAGDRLARGQGVVAPGGHHLVVKKNAMRDDVLIRLTSQPANALFIPSVDVTMHSVVEFFGKKTVGVLLTGMGADGADGMVAIRQAGGVTIAEDASTAVVFGMPREAIERGGAEIVAPSHQIAREIVKAVNRW
ncbi:chemotaxis-specific protein-glutamate methyltransferase CheB [Heliobacterium gestii]|uniref:Protein-glutamate methylesterase/protein-glutamine glutaminase n=1 Tax=Heliomicrobium gestii TaxID=2699 RepID=A0A845L922_HELGE|nr:chemotaxis response regulator protein-glutamate methylesterase [Heliomicrobium gestii]MBM7865850.1 two-component system chemotaxis response regulator CheB [Heliomicrobium gestii]MZP42091.1 chemotaxis-specific protein-glutamate methyltransferase CheB [Heliomicrobium gestii]